MNYRGRQVIILGIVTAIAISVGIKKDEKQKETRRSDTNRHTEQRGV